VPARGTCSGSELAFEHDDQESDDDGEERHPFDQRREDDRGAANVAGGFGLARDAFRGGAADAADADAGTDDGQARARGETREREILDTAKKEGQALLERARTEIRAEQDRAIATIRKQVVDLSLQAAGQVLRRKVDAADDRRLAEELLANAGGAREERK